MILPGQVILLRFPYADASQTKLRPALVVARLPGRFDDWLVSMISSQLTQQVEGFDEVLVPGDDDFRGSGLKVPSVVRLARLAVIERGLAVGALGEISQERLTRARARLATWLGGAASAVPR